ncbi:hypothetical protein [Kitasatospora sp. NPDC058218]|uniref:hypothetical protein n=1 Tax=Kitasatospora sp. NPDC058218 TaxID=3346385 RepID=UPI0036DE1AE1
MSTPRAAHRVVLGPTEDVADHVEAVTGRSGTVDVRSDGRAGTADHTCGGPLRR